MTVDAARCAQILGGSDHIVLLCHRDPDGDTLGSAFGLLDALHSLGKKARVECDSPLPKNLDFLYRDADWEAPFCPELVVAVDVASPKLLGAKEQEYPQIDLCIDHHPTNPGYAGETLLSPAAATGEPAMDVILAMECRISPKAATALLTAICSDTGGFRFSNTTGETLRKAASLIDAGADYTTIRQRLFENKSHGLVQVEAHSMQTINYYADGRIAVMKIPRAVMEEAGIADEELEGVASIPREIEGVDIGITLKEKGDGMIRVSVRSSENADAAALCEKFGGGGHKRAAGCRIRADLLEAEEQIAGAALEVLS